MPRSKIDIHQAEPAFLSETEHTAIGNSAPHHTRGHSFHNSTADHTDVNGGSPNDGDAMIYDSVSGNWVPAPAGFVDVTGEPTGFPNRIDSTISFDEGVLKFTIAPTVTSFDYYIKGIKYTVSSADDVYITDTEGRWYIYYNLGVLTASQTPWSSDVTQYPYAFVSALYWDSTNNIAIMFFEERHGLVMDWATHRRLHLIDGMQVQEPFTSFEVGDYILRGDGTSDSHCQLSVANGIMHDEDNILNIVNDATPTDPFEQKLSTIAYIPLYYRDGAAGNWRKLDATVFPVAYQASNTIRYNYWNGSTWTLQNATEGYFVNTWLLATNNIYEPIIGIVGQNEYDNVGLAERANYRAIEPEVPLLEEAPLHKLIFKTSTSYTNTPEAVLYAISDIVNVVLNTDRYAVKASYNGKANTGRYLEVFSGQSSDVANFVFPETSFIRTIIVNSTALSTGIISVYRITDLVNPVISISLSNEDYKRQEYSAFFDADEKIAFKVSNGSINKPSMMFWVQTDII